MEERRTVRARSAKKPATKPAKRTREDEPEEGAERRGRKISSRLAFVLVAAVAVAFLIYSLVTLIGIQSQLRDRRQELADIRGEITVQEIKNEEMNKTYSLSDAERSDYIEQIARDELDYVKEGERVFVNVAGE